jgi:uncharacterized protein (TIGR00251 family)
MITENNQGLIVDIKVITKASKNEIIGIENDIVRIKIHAIAEKGKANEAIISFLSDYLKWPKSGFSIIKGASSRHKTILIKNMKKASFLKNINLKTAIKDLQMT